MNTYKNIIKLNNNLHYDVKEKQLFQNNNFKKLSKKEKALLVLLIEAKGNIISFQNIEYLLWPDNPISSSTLRALICRLRAKTDFNIIKTIPSFGCKVILNCNTNCNVNKLE